MTYEPTEAQLLDDLQTQIAEILNELTHTLAPLIRPLVHLRQGGLVVIDPAALAKQDDAMRADRAERIEHYERSYAAGIVPLGGFTNGAGESPAAGNIAGISVAAEMHMVLSYQIRQLVRDQAKNGICTLVKIPTEPLIGDLLVGLRALVWQTTTMPLLNTVLAEVTQLRDHALDLIDGNDQTKLAANCPHCDRPTLTVYFRTGIIRCGRDPRTKHFEPCWCPDPLCTCKDRPTSVRHEWHRSRGSKPDGWYTLDRLINPERPAGERTRMLRDLEHSTTPEPLTPEQKLLAAIYGDDE